MTNLSFAWQIDEYLVYCHSRQLRAKTMASYEQSLRLFRRWCSDEPGITTVGRVTESSIRHYIISMLL